MAEIPIRYSSALVLLGATALLSSGFSCGAPSAVGPEAMPARAASAAAPSWCDSVERVLGTAGDARGFRCLALPNFLVTGFYGPERNPERSDFVNGCFAGDESAASRLRMSVRPVGNLGFRYRAEQELAASGGLDLGFLGPWAPALRLERGSTDRVSIEVELRDAEVRVLASVAEILAQRYDDGGDSDALEACIAALCNGGASAEDRLVYTAKVLSAVPVIRVGAASGRELRGGVQVARGIGSFELADRSAKSDSFELRAKEKLNVAALLEPALPAFESAAACQRVRSARARRELRMGMRELGLRTLAGRSLDSVAESSAALRDLFVKSAGAFSPHEESVLLACLEAIESAARQLARDKPAAETCSARVLFERVLSAPREASRVHDLLTDVAQPLHRRLTELANQHALPCAEPVWYRDADRDGYGDKKVSVRASRQPAGHVPNSLDCYDANPDVRPGQVRFFPQQRGDGSFDYDCDGQSSRQEEIVSGGCKEITLLGIPTHCWADAGWHGAVPECGQQGRWLKDCEVKLLSCSVMNEERVVQHCR
jgi:hypothetical protein